MDTQWLNLLRELKILIFAESSELKVQKIGSAFFIFLVAVYFSVFHCFFIEKFFFKGAALTLLDKFYPGARERESWVRCYANCPNRVIVFNYVKVSICITQNAGVMDFPSVGVYGLLICFIFCGLWVVVIGCGKVM